MKDTSSLKRLKRVLSLNNSCILYQPLKNEVNYNDSSFPLKIPKNKILLPTSKKSDPFIWVNKILSLYKNKNPYILIPGTKFDIYGTRKGRGGGWYDRFLSKVIKKWPKIGVCNVSQLSNEKLIREPWGETVDWLIVKDTKNWIVYETNSRNN